MPSIWAVMVKRVQKPRDISASWMIGIASLLEALQDLKLPIGRFRRSGNDDLDGHVALIPEVCVRNQIPRCKSKDFSSPIVSCKPYSCKRSEAELV